ncbi:MAG: murein biosynthesis integral membrane protein MurJ, partial [Gammaproteobacteria bacterium RBG_16_57_12]
MSKHLLKSTAVVGFMTLISRVLGLARDMVIARFFPIGAGTDAFFVAFKIPNFLRRLFAEGSFSQAFVPVLSEYRATRSDDEVRRLADHVAGTLAGVLFLVTLAGVLAAPLLIVLFAPGFMDDQPKLMLAADMLRITFPYILFISLASLASGVLNTYGRFAVPALTPVFLNLAMIGAAIWLAPLFDPPVLALAWGVFIGGVVQLLFQLPFLYRLRLLPRPRWGMADAGVRRILSLMGPSIFAVSVTQINLLINTVIASFLITGSVSWLYYSDRLVEFPLGVFGVALATVILPALSRKHAAAAPEEFSHTLDWALRWVALIGIPATLGLAMLSGPLLCALFQYGAFDSRDLEMSRLSLMAYSLGLLGFILVKVLVPGFYARQDTRTPVRVAVIALVSNLIMSMAFVMPMVRLDIPGPHAGLALA